jgi:acetyl esterase/lipase
MSRTVAVFLAVALWASAACASPTYLAPIYGVSKTSNILYGTGPISTSTLNLRLDLYRPTDIGQGAVPTESPGIVLIHGGGFFSGDKADMAPLAQTYAAYGYTVASINYRLLSNNVPPNSGPADGMI